MKWHWGRSRKRSRLLSDLATVVAFIVFACSVVAAVWFAGGCVGPVASPAGSQRNTGAGATQSQTQALLAAREAVVGATARLTAAVEQSGSAGRDAATGGVLASQATAGRDIYSGLDGGTAAVLICLFGLAAWKTIWRWRLARQTNGLGLNESLPEM